MNVELSKQNMENTHDLLVDIVKQVVRVASILNIDSVKEDMFKMVDNYYYYDFYDITLYIIACDAKITDDEFDKLYYFFSEHIKHITFENVLHSCKNHVERYRDINDNKYTFTSYDILVKSYSILHRCINENNIHDEELLEVINMLYNQSFNMLYLYKNILVSVINNIVKIEENEILAIENIIMHLFELEQDYDILNKSANVKEKTHNFLLSQHL